MSEEKAFLCEISNSKNKNCVRCQFCNSLILKPASASYVENEFKLPLMHQKNSVNLNDIETEIIKHFWIIDDMFTFENIGFSNTVLKWKYLICADCEMGPVGYHDMETEKSYVALKRVQHIDLEYTMPWCSAAISINDEYFHKDLEIEYCLENVLYRPVEETNEFLSLKTLFNSVLDNKCLCLNNCKTSKCSHSHNYKLSQNEHQEELVLNDDRISKDIMYECNMTCNCPSTCGNRVVQCGPRENLMVKISKILPSQNGLFTEKKIPKGAFICEYAGEILTRSEALKREKNQIIKDSATEYKNVGNYTICLKECSLDKEKKDVIETFIDPRKIGNIGRYINHSCEPNCEILSVRVDCPIPKLAVFSQRIIEPLEELYFHYGNGGAEIEQIPSDSSIKCLCRSKKCSSFLPSIKY